MLPPKQQLEKIHEMAGTNPPLVSDIRDYSSTKFVEKPTDQKAKGTIQKTQP